MQWLVFSALALLVVNGVRKMMRDAQEIGKDNRGQNKAASYDRPAPAARGQDQTKKTIAHETVQCAVCQAYVVAQMHDCGRVGCPYPKANKED